MKVRDILEHFLARSPWVDRETTVDRVIVGDGDTDVDFCKVAWAPSTAACRQTIEADAKLLVCHEPTFWDHFDKTPPPAAGGMAKQAFLADNDLTVVRLHDCWDYWPEIGVTDAWARFLGLGEEPATRCPRNAQHRYDIEPVDFDTFAANVATRTATIGEPTIEARGDGSRRVSRIGIGTGCITGVTTYLDMGCDCCILVDDGTAYWRDVLHAADLEIPVLCVNHATAEEPAMATLTAYINDHLEGVTAEHIAQGCQYRPVTAGGN